MDKYLSPTSHIVNNPEFENAVVKVLNNELAGLTPQEEESIKRFISPDSSDKEKEIVKV